jgi:predicted nucleic acid-binding protein
MSIAKTWDCTVATDDMTAAVKYCQSNNIPLIGTLGILYKGYEQKVITNIEAENLLQTLITNKYYKSPVSDFKSVIDSFERNIGKKLY